MFRKIVDKFKEAQAERERKRLELRSWLVRPSCVGWKKQRLERRRSQENIIAVLEDDKLPDLDWDVLVGPLPFRFMKSEHLIYVFPHVGYAEMRVKREIVGRSAGTSVRVAKGVSVRVGASRGTPVESDEIVGRGTGIMAVTTKHIYFNGERSFRIRLDKIVSVEQLSDAVAVTGDRAGALPEYFIVGEEDSSFAYDLVQAIPSLELGPGTPERQSPDNYHVLILDGGDYIIDDSS